MEIPNPLKRLIKRKLRQMGLHISRVFPESEETESLCLLRLKAHAFQPHSILDIGASDGRWTRAVLRLFPEAQYLLVEPRGECGHALTSLETSNPKVRVVRVMIGESAGSAAFHVNGLQSSMFPPLDPNVGRFIELQVTTIDALITALQFPAPQLMKLDIQGAELQALRGAESVLPQVELVLAEASFYQIYRGIPLAHELIIFMARHDFVIADLCEFSRNERNILSQCMIAFVRKSSSIASVLSDPKREGASPVPQ